ncbi:MAG: primary-amine oxidase, partial [Pseudonocardiaceae bacterium]
MTVTQPPSTITQPPHPLAMVTEEEIDRVREIASSAGMLGETVRFAFCALEEPDKQVVLSHAPDEEIDRRFRVVLLDLATGNSRDVVISVTRSAVDSVVDLDPRADGQPPIIDTEFELIEDILNADDGWRAALERRSLDPATVRAVPLSAGSYDVPGEEGRRVVRALGFQQLHEKDHPWAHPVDGLVAYVDLTSRAVTKVIDHRLLAVPQEPGNFDDPAQVGPQRTTLRPIEITQPEGPSFGVDGNEIEWQNWRLRIGFNEREGLTLHQISFADRPVVYRASVAEMVVPYADPSPVRFWQNYFDCGEYMFARYTNSLELGCDCLGEIRYFDATIADDLGRPQTIRNAICVHEEDFGLLWKH